MRGLDAEPSGDAWFRDDDGLFVPAARVAAIMAAHREDRTSPTDRVFLDLWAVVAAVVLTGLVVVLPVVRESPVRVVVGLAFVLFAPGYALVAALFPERGADGDSDGGIDGLERAVLSFGASIAVVPLVGLVVNFTPWGITLAPVVVSLAALTLGLTALAGVRRARIVPQRRFAVSVPSLAGARDELLNPADRTDAVLNVVLVVSLLVAASTVTYAVAAPTQGETFTELSLLTENDDGELTASDYPRNFTQGDAEPLVVAATNQEGERTNYTLVAELQRVSVVDGDVSVEEANELHRYAPTLADDESWQQRHLVEPEMTGENLRLQYSLYRGEAATGDAYRTVNLWVNVSQPDTA